MLKKIIITILGTKHNKDMLNIFMHQTIKINERRKERRKTKYLFHERALLMKFVHLFEA